MATRLLPTPASLDTRGNDYKLPVFPVADPGRLKGIKVLVISADGPELPELLVPMDYLLANGAEVTLAAQSWTEDYRKPARHIVVAQWLADNVCIQADTTLSKVNIEDYDALYIPGGAWNPDMLRSDPEALRLVRKAYENDLLVVSICHGPQVLISAAADAPDQEQNFPARDFHGKGEGVHLTGVASIRRDLKNAGFTVYDDHPVVYDWRVNLLTARDPNDLGALCEEMGRHLSTRLTRRAN